MCCVHVNSSCLAVFDRCARCIDIEKGPDEGLKLGISQVGAATYYNVFVSTEYASWMQTLIKRVYDKMKGCSRSITRTVTVVRFFLRGCCLVLQVISRDTQVSFRENVSTCDHLSVAASISCKTNDLCNLPFSVALWKTLGS